MCIYWISCLLLNTCMLAHMFKYVLSIYIDSVDKFAKLMNSLFNARKTF